MGKYYLKPVIELILDPLANVLLVSGGDEYFDNGEFDGTWEDFEE